MPVDMEFAVKNVSDFDIIRSKSKLIASLDFYITMYVSPLDGERQKVGVMEFNDTAIDFTLTESDLKVTAALNDLDISHVYVKAQHLGDLDVSIMRTFFNLALNAAVPFFNVFFS